MDIIRGINLYKCLITNDLYNQTTYLCINKTIDKKKLKGNRRRELFRKIKINHQNHQMRHVCRISKKSKWKVTKSH